MRFTLRAKLNRILQEFETEILGEPFELSERFNICPNDKVPVIRQTDDSREMVRMQWGFLPSWTKLPVFAPFIAPAETVATKPFFRNAIKQCRCLITADGFYEWQRTEGAKVKGESPWLFEVQGGKPFAFAGIWERNGELESCAILTTHPNEMMAPIHDRFPVILSPADYAAWLDPAMTDTTKLLSL